MRRAAILLSLLAGSAAAQEPPADAAYDARVKAAYAPDTYRRLVALKDVYDPQNVFRLNQNIAPSHLAGGAPGG